MGRINIGKSNNKVKTVKADLRKSTGLQTVLLFCMLAIVTLSFPTHAEELVDATADYDSNNVFARILRGDLPADIVFESEYALAFHDINPQAKVHVLIIPKGQYTNITRFNADASDEEKLGFLDAISQTATIMKVDESGFKLVSNTGQHAGQTVPHFHFHLLGGEPVQSQ